MLELALVVSAAIFAAALIYAVRHGGQGRHLELSRITGDFHKEIQELKSAMKDQSLALSRQVEEQMSRNSTFLQETHKGYFSAVGDLHLRMGELQSAAKSMIDIGKDISSLQDILQSPKLRGGIGELLLGELLRQILPDDHFSLQYGFKNGCKVDAVIRLGAGLIPVDAKFPLENFKRMGASGDETQARSAKKQFVVDVKKHIDSISQKYILPEEGTFDFALMYIPAENIYYEIIIKEDTVENLCQYAWEKKVIPVSPNSFYVYLEAIVRGLKGLRIEKSAQIILESLGQMESEFRKCQEEYDKLGSHLSHAQASYDRGGRKFVQLGERFNTLGHKASLPAEDKKPEAELFTNS